MQVLDSLVEVNAERQKLEERVAQFWKEQQEILLEAEVRVEVVREGESGGGKGRGGWRWEGKGRVEVRREGESGGGRAGEMRVEVGWGGGSALRTYVCMYQCVCVLSLMHLYSRATSAR